MNRICCDYPCPACRYNLRGLDMRHRCPECGHAYDATTPRSRSRLLTGLSGFDKFCAVLATMLAVPLLILGLIGLFVGCGANFTLPPILGVIPALVSWGIFRCTLIAWRATHFVDAAASLPGHNVETAYREPTRASVESLDREIDRQRAATDLAG